MTIRCRRFVGIGFLLMLVCVAGCGASGALTPKGQEWLSPALNKAQLVIFREDQLEAERVALPVEVDGVLVASLAQDEFLELFVPPGVRYVAVGPLRVQEVVRLEVVAGEKYYLRHRLEMAGEEGPSGLNRSTQQFRSVSPRVT